MKMMRKLWMLGALGAVLLAGCAQEASKPEGDSGSETTTTTGGAPAPDPGSNATGETTGTPPQNPDAGKPETSSTSSSPYPNEVDPKKPIGTEGKPGAVATEEIPSKDGKVEAMNATTKPDAAKPPTPNPAVKPTPNVPPSPRESASMDRLDKLASKADPKTTASSYLGNWSFKMTDDNAKKLKQGIMGAGYKGTFYTPSYQMTISPNGTFTAKEQFMSFDRTVSGTYKFEKGALRCTIKMVNGAAPKAKSDKAGWALIINKEGKLERSDEIKLSKK